jgi:hypothetical protein
MHRLVWELISNQQTSQQTALVMHIIVIERIPRTTQPLRKLIGEAPTRQRTDSLKHKLVSELIPYTSQPRQGTDSPKHRPSANLCDAPHILFSELIR